MKAKFTWALMALLMCFGSVVTLAPAPVAAAEYVGDTTLTTNPLTLQTGWTAASSKVSATNVWGKRAFKLTSGIKKGKTYRWTITTLNYSGTGSLQVYIGGVRTPAMGSYVLAPTPVIGETTIADNFDPTPTYITGLALPPDDVDPNGAFRFNCLGAPRVIDDDPIVYPNQPGSAHTHLVYGNTSFNAFSTYKSLRTRGGTNCGDPRYPVYRSAFWTPAMFDGAGNVILPSRNPLVYYKGLPKNFAACNATVTVAGDGARTWVPSAQPTKIGKCVSFPNGLRFLRGWNMTEMTGGPAVDSGFRYYCEDGTQGSVPGTNPSGYVSLKQLRDAGCAPPNYIRVLLQGPTCWDGRYLDTPNHHDHVAYATGAAVPLPESTAAPSDRFWPQCDANHPYEIASFSVQIFYKLDKNYMHWRLSSDDQMTMEHEDGSTLHVDYWEAWSPDAKAKWEAGCTDGHYTCNSGELGNTTAISQMEANQSKSNGYLPYSRKGRSRYIKGNGTFTGEFTAVADGELGLYGIGGLNIDIDTFSIVDVANAGPRNSVAVVVPAM